ncbi:MAG: dienelactone hydrolase family protein [Myxococcota bacterium]
MSSVLDCVEIEPHAPAQGTVIWLHGLGASGHDFEPIVPALGLPQIRFVFPHAPAAPVTINGGYVMPSWYDIRSLDLSSDRESAQDIRRSALKIEALIARENDRGIPTERIVVAGFSQGGAMALHVGLRYPVALCGIVSLSAYLVLPSTLSDEAHAANFTTPVLICHGVQDPTVPFQAGQHARDLVRGLSATRDISWHEFPMQHEVCPAEVSVISEWLQARFAAFNA